MDFDTFKKKVKDKIPVNKELDNPGGGTSIIMSYSDNRISYKRRNSTFYVSLHDLFDSYSNFTGQKVTSNDLRSYAPSVYDREAHPSGHGCNCTFLFMVLEYIGIVDKTHGKGVKGNPFFVNIPNEAKDARDEV